MTVGATNLDPPDQIKFLSSSNGGLEFEWEAPEAPVTHFIVKLIRNRDNTQITDIKKPKDEFKVMKGQNREVYQHKVDNLEEGEKYLIQVFSANLSRNREKFSQVSVSVSAEATVTSTMLSARVVSESEY